ncbi:MULTISPECIES: site-2 protease family protein [Prochlorococcus]|uniref:Zinc metalloprotease n=1 Tax=Prochlorococcus marinus str. MIT 9116 TaxID=167544 RepID=A0A0A1ZT79_PROMR|nr:site-2 protease family protein [Prochlorococcus marinus]KGF90995.1 Metal dependent membrane associated protease [Prochlorococcus marinus str. MIT 9107]KGF91454.1 Metal dependent membrane associated protease [Prochlorococcus marinus str. MIT 9116]KGF93308.1 Metal dependent membrane associated protease [Prochlorococcus marinus str. MIT 9123]
MRSWQIFKIWGIPFKIHPYWFAILFIFSWSISNQVNLTSGDIYNTKEAWIIGFLTSFFLLSSIISHEVLHTFVSLNQGVKIKKITFYFLGAILQIDRYCQTALGNIKIAIVRPILCFATAFILLLISNYSESQELISINIISRVGILNLFLGFLNLMPIGSLDGGNLLKSIIWHFSGSKNKGRDFLNKVNLSLSFFVLILGMICFFRFNFYYGFILSFLGLFGVNSAKSESQFYKIEKILKFSKVSELKLKPLRKIKFDSNFSEFNSLIKNKKDTADKYFFVANNGRWTGFVDENILKNVSIKKWERNFVGDFKKPINSFASVYSNDKLWKTIERLEENGEGFILVLNAANIPLGIIDRSKIGQFVLNKLGFNFSSEIINKLNYKNQYPLGIELPRIINSMKQKGDL